MIIKMKIYVSKKNVDDMLIGCKEKLLACSQRSCGKFEAFFDCKDCSSDFANYFWNVRFR